MLGFVEEEIGLRAEVFVGTADSSITGMIVQVRVRHIGTGPLGSPALQWYSSPAANATGGTGVWVDGAQAYELMRLTGELLVRLRGEPLMRLYLQTWRATAC